MLFSKINHIGIAQGNV